MLRASRSVSVMADGLKCGADVTLRIEALRSSAMCTSSNSRPLQEWPVARM